MTMAANKPNPTLAALASRIYSYREEGESWTNAVDRYARDVLMRHPRTVHRWLSGESPMPAVVSDSLAYADLDAFENSIAPCDHD
jgi:hypothetical protein